MARREAVLPLHETLRARSADRRKILARELANLRDFKATDSAADSGDVAFENCNDEMSSQLAELDARELSQIERALDRLKHGAYGVCEKCQKKIRVPRLNALPNATFCINCEREMEKYPEWQERHETSNWDQVFDSQAPMHDQQFSLSELEMDLSSKRASPPR